jgi:RNA polymerase sigma-70 factor (ECF subfamily)
MANAPSHSTRISLLLRIREDPGDQSAWRAFVDRFGPLLHQWCMSWGLQEADAQDVTQSVLLKLARILPNFAYDPTQSFRGWLRTITHRTWSDFVDAQRRAVRGAADSVVNQLLESVEAREDLFRRLQEGFDTEIAEQAMEQVRERVESHTWEAFRLTALDGVLAPEAAQRLGMRVATVYRARSVVQAMLRDAIVALSHAEAPTC